MSIVIRLRALASAPEMDLSHLTCPTCHFSVATAAASSPFQNCPRCLLREHTAVMMVVAPEPRRFGRRAADMDRIAEAKARLSGPVRGASSA